MRPLIKENDNEPFTPPHSESWSSCLRANILISITYMSYVGGIISSQLTTANVLQINCMRYTIISSIALCAVCLHNYTLKINYDHIGRLLTCISLHQFYGTTFYFAASFMPAGTFDGLQGAVATVMATSYDIYKKNINKFSVMSSVGVVIGILLLTQPWKEQNQVHLRISPCEYLENTSQPFRLNISNTLENHQSQYGTLQIWFDKYKSIIGYVLIIMTSTMSVARGVIIRQLLHEYPVPTVTFWHAAIEAISTITLNLIWSKSFTKPFFDKPSGTLCWIFTMSFVAFAACGNGLGYSVYKHTHISTTAVMDISFLVFLYLSQRTFLKPFYPGHANAVEFIGIIVVSFSVSVLRLISFLIEKYKSK